MSEQNYQSIIEEALPNMEIQYRAGKGAMGEVYSAIQQPLGRKVALKVLPPEYNRDPERRKRFLREAKSLSQLSHPNLVKFYDFGGTDDFMWMMLEWVEGKSLHQAELEGGLAVNEALTLVCKVCAALSHAHEHGVVHRDVKPANILLSGDGEVKLSDFGLARDTQGDANSIISVSGNKFGSAEYAAPEFWKDGFPIDHRVDIFSLGVLLYEALTGQRPAGVFRMPSQINPDLDPRLDGVIVRAMQEMPEQRYQNCDEFMDAIKEVMHVPYNNTLLNLNTAPVAIVPATGPETASILAAKVQQSAPLQHTAPVMLHPKSSSGMMGKLVLILSLVGLLLGVRYMMKDKLEKVDQQQAKADARMEKELASREEIKHIIEEERKARATAAIEEEEDSMEEEEVAENVSSEVEEYEGTEGSDPVPVLSSPALDELDKRIISQAKNVIKQFREKQQSMQKKYITVCMMEEETAVQSGNLELVLFWQNEIKAIQVDGEPILETDGIPDKAKKLRTIWHKEMGAHQAKVSYLQKSYIETCQKISERHMKNGEDQLANLTDYRAMKVVDRDEFFRLCNGEEISSGMILPVNSELPKLGAKLINSNNIERLFDGVSDNSSNDFFINVIDHFTIDLAQIYHIKKMRFKLLDQDNRDFFYVIMASMEGDSWTVISDRSSKAAKSWQEVEVNGSYRFIKFKDAKGVREDGVETWLHIQEMELTSK